jgi:hypothetical protein
MGYASLELQTRRGVGGAVGSVGLFFSFPDSDVVFGQICPYVLSTEHCHRGKQYWGGGTSGCANLPKAQAVM